ncbi:MAG: nuclear transport factor 2 family protein [Pseudomonadota bacterium]
MSAHAALLFANESFYQAFLDRDMALMEALWAHSAGVSCIHPGWPVLSDRCEVMKSWSEILANPQAPKIKCRAPLAHQMGEIGYVVCYEEIANTLLVATNVFVREDQQWRISHHQAGPCQRWPDDLPECEPLPQVQ